jgi:hypothetical protein
MTKRLVVPLTVLAFATNALAQEKRSIKPDVTNQPPAEVQRAGPGMGTAKRTTTGTFKVKEVDLGKRVLVLQNATGASQTMQVGPSVMRMEDISPGDTVNVKYEQNLTLEYRPEGSGASDSATTTSRAVTGAPAAKETTQTRSDCKVTKIDEKSRTVTLQPEKGKPFKVKAGPDIDLSKVKVGQTYYANYTETVAVRVEKPAAKAAPAPAK